jgi:hypothetical protein
MPHRPWAVADADDGQSSTTILDLQTQECIDDLNAKGGEPLCILRPDAACAVWAGAQAAIAAGAAATSTSPTARKETIL